MRSLAVFASVTLIAGSSAAQIDIESQAITIDVTQTGSMTIIIDAEVRATAAASSMVFYRPLLPVALAQVGGQPVTVAPHPTYPQYASRVIFPQPLAAGQTTSLHLELAGEPTCSISGFPGVFCVRDDSETVLTTAMPGASWYLANLFDLDPFTGSITVLAPEAHTVLAGAHDAVSIDPQGDGTALHQFDIDLPTEILAVYSGVADTHQIDGVRVIHHGGEHDAENVAFIAEVAQGVRPIFESHYGELPLEDARFVMVPQNFGFGGLGLLGMILINEVVVGPWSSLIEQGIPHELAHSWWGNLASGSDPYETRFLHEAFAEYSGWRALGELKGDALRTTGMRMNAVWYMYRRPNDADVAVLSPDANGSPAAIHVTYHKGALVVRTLEQAAGEEAFAEALRAFLARGYGGLTIDGLIADIATASGYDATADVEQWLRRTGFPRVSAIARFEEGALNLSLDTDGDFTFALPVRLMFADGSMVEQTVELSPGSREHAIALDARPIAVEIDPRWTAVREIVPALQGDVTLDGEVDGADLVAMAVHHGGELPFERRVDGRYDPLYDVDRDGFIGDADLELVRAAVSMR